MSDRRADALVVAAVQPACTAHDVAANAAVHAEQVRAAAARVVVFPELSLTGYERAAARSRIWSPDGALAARAVTETGGIARATLTRSRVLSRGA